MTTYPITYSIDIERNESWPMAVRSGARPPLASGPPPEFGGAEAWWSPEHLLVSAVASCFTATFFGAARGANLPVVAFTCRGEGVLDRTPKGPLFTGFHLAVDLTVRNAEEAERAKELLLITKRRCFVANSVISEVTVTPNVRLEAETAA